MIAVSRPGPQGCNRIAATAAEQIARARRGHRSRPPKWARRLWRMVRRELDALADAVAALEGRATR